MLATRLILGLPWGVMHLPAYAASGAVPPALEVAAIFFYFVPYRMLMVWVYDHTQSVLMAMLMHLPLIVFCLSLVVQAVLIWLLGELVDLSISLMELWAELARKHLELTL